MSAVAIFETLEVRRLLSTNLVADYGGIYPTDSVEVNGVSYFSANDGAHGTELWKSDGTVRGTRLVKDITPGTDSSDIVGLTAGDGLVYFFKVDDSQQRLSVWRSDGTTAGTFKLADVSHYEQNLPHAFVNGKLVFVEYSGATVQSGDSNSGLTVNLWSTDGTVAGTMKLAQVYSEPDPEQVNTDFLIAPMCAVGNRVLFLANKIWTTDGTGDGTSALDAPSYEFHLCTTILNGKVIYAFKNQLWSTDGTADGTAAFATLPNDRFGTLNLIGDKIFFGLNGSGVDGDACDIFVSDGTTAGTRLLQEIPHMNYGARVFGSAGNLTLFVNPGTDPDFTVDLWATDGTPAGTHKIMTLGQTYLPTQSISVGGMYFVITKQISDDKVLLWQSDGTTQGTKVLMDLSSLSSGVKLESVDGKLVIIPDNASESSLVFDPATMVAPVGPTQGTTYLKDGVLRIYGTLGDDFIRVYHSTSSASRFVVNLNGVKRSFALADVARIYIYGFSGNDNLSFYDGYGRVMVRSRIWGGDGNDTVYTGLNRDTVFGEAGDDYICTSGNDDSVSGGNGDDSINTGAGNDTASGDDGSDHIDGGAGSDVVSGGNDGNKDWISGGIGSDVIFGSAVFDIFYAGKKATDILGDDSLLMVP